ncbi:hypothetical protein SKAU_G00358300 [Synaphobranchus kaupii]|uniref:Probable RNA-binding protein 18 n=1 Tax=Synaphobranchus kaupii TaxID=118154 RepID=A0A9Q1IGU5_SYNKA|nr:hypothetical protein SKAU_G00358300 [Synaphobranchus kaupii]
MVDVFGAEVKQKTFTQVLGAILYAPLSGSRFKERGPAGPLAERQTCGVIIYHKRATLQTTKSMQSAAETLENASILSESTSQEGHRLWIGNIDPKITEYHLVKLLEKFGKVKQFDFLFHKSGPLEGQPRGYCFVNFHTKEEAERAIQCLNGKLALSKKLVVRWAHAQVKKFDHLRGDKAMPASLEPSSSAEEMPTSLSVNAKIRAIEAKLQMMDENPRRGVLRTVGVPLQQAPGEEAPGPLQQVRPQVQAMTNGRARDAHIPPAVTLKDFVFRKGLPVPRTTVPTVLCTETVLCAVIRL